MPGPSITYSMLNLPNISFSDFILLDKLNTVARGFVSYNQTTDNTHKSVAVSIIRTVINISN